MSLEAGMVLHYEQTPSESSSVIELSRPEGFVGAGTAMCLLLRVAPRHSLILLIHENDNDLPAEVRCNAGKDCFTYMAIHAPLAGTTVSTPDGDVPGQLQFTRGFQTRPSWLELPQHSNIRTVHTADLSPLLGAPLNEAPRLLKASYALLPTFVALLLQDRRNRVVPLQANIKKGRIWLWMDDLEEKEAYLQEKKGAADDGTKI